MKHLAFLIFVVIGILTGCSSNQATVHPPSAKKDAMQNSTVVEILAGYDYLAYLHKHHLIPGDTRGVKGTADSGHLNLSQLPPDVTYPFSWTYFIILDGQAGFTNCYTVGRESKSSGWKLERAWRVDTNGATVQEWQLK
jgi:hypothetical protein